MSAFQETPESTHSQAGGLLPSRKRFRPLAQWRPKQSSAQLALGSVWSGLEPPSPLATCAGHGCGWDWRVCWGALLASLQAPCLAAEAGAVLTWVFECWGGGAGQRPGRGALSWGTRGPVARRVQRVWDGSLAAWGDLGDMDTQLWRGGFEDQLEVGGAGPLWIPAPDPHPGVFSELGACSAGTPGPRSLPRCPLQGRGRGSAGATPPLPSERQKPLSVQPPSWQE